MQTIDLTHHFLIAMPNMVDPNFSRTLTYICEHNDRGALGVVINRPTEITLGQLFAQVEIDLERHDRRAEPVFFGGPVQTDRGFVLHRPVGHWQSTLPIRDDIGLTTSRDVLQAFAQGEGPGELLVTLGYAGWSPGQLEDEIRQNAWLTVAAEVKLIFELAPEARLPAAMNLLGVNPAFLYDEAGHA